MQVANMHYFAITQVARMSRVLVNQIKHDVDFTVCVRVCVFQVVNVLCVFVTQSDS